MNFNFIGGSIGSAVGEKFQDLLTFVLRKNTTSYYIKSGGARMMESGLSLMQLAKTSEWLYYQKIKFHLFPY